MPKTQADLFAFLAGLGIQTKTTEHPALFTVAASRTLRGELAGGHTKNLLVKDKKGAVFLIVAQEDRALDLKSLHKAIGASGRLSFADADKMMVLLGVEPGSVTAFGLLNDEKRTVRLVLDEGLLQHDMINCHPLTNTATTTIRREDLLTFFAATGHAPLVLALERDESGDLGAAGEPVPDRANGT